MNGFVGRSRWIWANNKWKSNKATHRQKCLNTVVVTQNHKTVGEMIDPRRLGPGILLGGRIGWKDHKGGRQRNIRLSVVRRSRIRQVVGDVTLNQLRCSSRAHGRLQRGECFLYFSLASVG